MTKMRKRARSTPDVMIVAALVLACLSCPTRTWAQQNADPGERTPTRLSVDLSAGYERLGTGRPSWRELFAGVAAEFAPRASVNVGAAYVNRFGQSDAQLTVGGSYPLGARWTAGADLQGSESHRVLARVAAQGWLHRRLPGGWGAQLGAQRREFTTARVETATALVERYVGRHRLAYQMGVSRVNGRTVPANHRVNLTYGTASGNAMTFGASSGHEAEAIGDGRTLLMRVRALNAWGLRPLSDPWQLIYSLGIQQQAGLYTRTSARLGVRHGWVARW